MEELEKMEELVRSARALQDELQDELPDELQDELPGGALD